MAGKLRLDLAQYRELLMFTQFGAEVDKTTQAQLTRGARMVEVLKQDQYSPLPMARQIMIIYAGTKGFLDDLAVNRVRKFEAEFYRYMEKNLPSLERRIEEKKVLDTVLCRNLSSLAHVASVLLNSRKKIMVRDSLF